MPPATTSKTQGCAAKQVPPASVFNDGIPEDVDTDQWCKAIASFGGKYATMVVKHGCGFLIYPTNASSGGFKYDYGVPPGRDLIRQFAESCAGVGVQLGICKSDRVCCLVFCPLRPPWLTRKASLSDYSVPQNSYLNVVGGQVQNSTLAPGQVKITQEQYADIVVQQLTELWSNCAPPNAPNIVTTLQWCTALTERRLAPPAAC